VIEKTSELHEVDSPTTIASAAFFVGSVWNGKSILKAIVQKLLGRNIISGDIFYEVSKEGNYCFVAKVSLPRLPGTPAAVRGALATSKRLAEQSAAEAMVRQLSRKKDYEEEVAALMSVYKQQPNRMDCHVNGCTTS